MDTKKLLPTKEFQYSTEAKEHMNTLLTAFTKKVIHHTNGENILHNIPNILPTYIADGAKHSIQDAIKNNKPVIAINKLLPPKFISINNKVLLSYLLQYIVTEVLDLATNRCRDTKKKRITKAHIEYVIKNDHELSMIFASKSHSSKSK